MMLQVEEVFNSGAAGTSTPFRVERETMTAFCPSGNSDAVLQISNAVDGDYVDVATEEGGIKLSSTINVLYIIGPGWYRFNVEQPTSQYSIYVMG